MGINAAVRCNLQYATEAFILVGVGPVKGALFFFQGKLSFDEKFPVPFVYIISAIPIHRRLWFRWQRTPGERKLLYFLTIRCRYKSCSCSRHVAHVKFGWSRHDTDSWGECFDTAVGCEVQVSIKILKLNFCLPYFNSLDGCIAHSLRHRHHVHVVVPWHEVL